MEKADSNTVEITLEHPFTLPTGARLEKVTVRRPKVRDMKNAQKRGGSAEEKELVLFAAICEPALTPEDFEEMDLEDYGQLQRTFRRMLDGHGNPLGGGGAAG